MPGRRKPPGSRLLLAAALLGGVAVALLIGASIPEILAGLAGVASRTLRLVLKVVGVIVALPIAFYLVERFFQKRSRGGEG
jgi:hypothetical protein